MRRTARSRCSYDWSAAFASGVFGAVVLTTLMWLSRWLGIFPFNVEYALGSLITSGYGPIVWLLGFGWHVLNGGLFGLLYAAIFRFRGRVSAGTGALIAMTHWVIIGVVLAWLPGLHPLMPEFVRAPGAFALGLGGVSFALVLLGHLIFGATVGALYQQSTSLRAEDGKSCFPDANQSASDHRVA